jgi:hypothetical protein
VSTLVQVARWQSLRIHRDNTVGVVSEHVLGYLFAQQLIAASENRIDVAPVRSS